MTTFRLIVAVATNFILMVSTFAQSFTSFLYPIADTAYTQSFTPRIHNNHIYVLNATFENGFSGANSSVYIEEYAFDGLQLGHTRIDPVLPQLYQVVNLQPMLWLDDRLLVSTDRITLTEDQRAVVFGFNADITNAWTYAFASNTSVSTSGILLSSNADQAFHASIRSSQTTDKDDLALSIIDKDGQVIWTKYTPLPAYQEREYLRVMAGANTQDNVIALCQYGLPSETFTRNQLSVIDTSGNLLEHKDLPVAGEPLLANRPGSDTFYLTESKQVNNHAYYCLNTYVGSVNNLINTACSDEIDAASSDYEYDMRVDPQGNVYVVGSTVLAGDSLYIGQVAKWSSAGELLWKKSYRLGAYPQGVFGFAGLDFAPNGKILISGGGNDDHALPFPQRFTWLLTLDENGCYDGNCDDLVVLEGNIVPTHELPTLEATGFQVYPNPASTAIMLNCPSAGQIRLFDMQGRILLDRNVTSGTLSLPLAPYPLGLYFLQFSAGKTSMITTKIIIER